MNDLKSHTGANNSLNPQAPPTREIGGLGSRVIGKPIDRSDGIAKVTGRAKYAAEPKPANLLYGVIVSSEITKGRIRSFAVEAAKGVPGVVDVLWHGNRPGPSSANKKYQDQDAPPGEHFRALHDERILYAGQPIALVVAENYEAARYGASLVRADYERDPHETNLDAARPHAKPPKPAKSGFEKPIRRGDAEGEFSRADRKIEAEYHTPMEHHNPMETFASTVVFEGDGAFTIYDKTQGTKNSLDYTCNVFDLDPKKVTVLAPYVGGAFGSALRPQYSLQLALLAAIKLERSVRVVLTRPQMFSFGFRPSAIQTVKLATDSSGILRSIEHSVAQQTSRFENYTENIVNWSGMLYHCDHVKLDHSLVELDTFTPLDMRAPGATTGLFALESAVDEMAYAVGMDPLHFRRLNYSEHEQGHLKRSFSSKELRAAYDVGSARFGWANRPLEPRSLRDGKKRVGWGMATGVWEANHNQAKASVEFTKDGRLVVTSAITDIGTGTYTILTQIGAETLGLDLRQVETRIGDSRLPMAPLQGGSWTASTVGTAVFEACRALGKDLHRCAERLPDSPFRGVKFEDVSFREGRMIANQDADASIALTEILVRSDRTSLVAEGSTKPNPLKQMPYARNTHSAVFIEVKVDEDHGSVEVSRAVAAVAAGRILNPKTARSQIIGGIVWGISQALHEHSVMDDRLGRIMNANFADYHIPVNRDIPEIDVQFVPEDDEIASPIGVKGVGEIGIVGTAAAVANAVFHATGRRVRTLPITLDRLL